MLRPVKITILDTTLRDGTQSPGFDMCREDKVAVASSLEKMGVDIIEAGFPASSPSQFDDASAVAGSLTSSAVSVMARAVEDDIIKAGKAIRNAAVRYIHTSISTSPIHRRYKLKKSRSVILDMAVDAVLCASEYADFVEIGAEDATRTEPEFLAEFCTMVTDAGADVVNIADTTGYIQPEEFYRMIRRLHDEVRAFKDGRSRISVHCHNDLGLAAANTLAGIRAGAIQAEVTLLGLGERAGNAPLEEIVMALTARSDYYSGFYTGIKTGTFAEAARRVSAITGIPSSPLKPVAGRNVHTHAAGIHQHGIMSSPASYSILPAGGFGYRQATFSLTRHSGSAGLSSMLGELSPVMDQGCDAKSVLEQFKLFADEKTSMTSTDIILFFNSEKLLTSQVWQVDRSSCECVTGSKGSRVKIVFFSSNGAIKKLSSSGTDRWTVLVSMLLSTFRLDLEMLEYSFTAAGTGSRFTERCFLVLRHEGVDYSEEASGGDVLILMVECFLGIVNRIIAKYQIVLK